VRADNWQLINDFYGWFRHGPAPRYDNVAKETCLSRQTVYRIKHHPAARETALIAWE
jgi:hypothetical protein